MLLDDIISSLDGATISVISVPRHSRPLDPQAQELTDLCDEHARLNHSFHRTHTILEAAGAVGLAAAVKTWWIDQAGQFETAVHQIMGADFDPAETTEDLHEMIVKVTEAIKPLVQRAEAVDKEIKRRHKAAFRSTDLLDLLT